MIMKRETPKLRFTNTERKTELEVIELNSVSHTFATSRDSPCTVTKSKQINKKGAYLSGNRNEGEDNEEITT